MRLLLFSPFVRSQECLHPRLHLKNDVHLPDRRKSRTISDDLKPDDCRKWWEDYVEIVATQDDGEEVSTAKVAAFLQLTERLAQAVVDLDLDPTPLNQFRQNAEGCYFGVQERLPAAGEAVHLLLDRLRQELTRRQRQAAQGAPVPHPRDQATKGRQPIPDDEANLLVRKYLEKHPQAGAREVAEAVGIALGRVSKLSAWRAEQGRRKANKELPKKGTRPLTKKMLNAIGKEDDPSAKMEAEEAVWRKILEEASPEGRAELHAMSAEKRREMIEAAR